LGPESSVHTCHLHNEIKGITCSFLSIQGVPWRSNIYSRVSKIEAFVLSSFGSRLADALAAAEDLEGFGLSTTVADARFAKPLDADLLRRLAQNHEVLVLLEEGASGGFAAQALEHLARHGLLDHGLKVRPMTMPDRFVDHAAPDAMIRQSGLDRAGIVETVFRALGESAQRVLQA